MVLERVQRTCELEASENCARHRNRHMKRAVANHPEIRVKNTRPAIIDETLFQRVQEILRERAPKIRHPRTISSDYLLSGLGFCKNCGAKLIGATAKSGKFFYYGCQNYLKKGKQACDSGLVNREKLEQSVVARIKERILTDKNLTELVKMVNEELARLKTDSSEILAQIDGQLDECTKRLQRLFAAVETGKMELDDLAPRIRELKQQIEQLQSKRRGIETENVRAIQVTQSEIQHYVEDLRSLLMTGTLIERKSFLRSWIRRVEFSKSAGGEIEYCLPLISTGKDYEKAPDREVLSIGKVGSPGRGSIRTSWDITVLIGIPFSRWGARPFAIDPLPFPVAHIEQLIHRIDRGSKSAIRREHPIHVAWRWQERLANNPTLTRAQVAAREGVSRARVTQVMSLLVLPPHIQHFLGSLTDTRQIRFFSERRLRRLLSGNRPSALRDAWERSLNEFRAQDSI